MIHTLLVLVSLAGAPGEALDEPPPLPPGALVTPPSPEGAKPPADEGLEPPAAAEAIPGLLPAVPRIVVQSCAGCAATAALGPLGMIPVVGWALYPAAIATVVTFVGDALGQTRGALVWPILATFGAVFGGALLVAGGVFGALGIFAGGLATVATLLADNPNPLAFVGVFLASYALAAVVIIASVAAYFVLLAAAPVCAYAFAAEPKRPGDGDLRVPGLLEPSHGKSGTQQQVRRGHDGPHLAGAMAY